MSKLINPDDVPQSILKEYIKTVQEIHGYKVISYKKIKSELKELFGVNVDIDRIEENCDDCSIDVGLQHKNLGMIW